MKNKHDKMNKNYGFCVACFAIETFGRCILPHDCIVPKIDRRKPRKEVLVRGNLKQYTNTFAD